MAQRRQGNWTPTEAELVPSAVSLHVPFAFVAKIVLLSSLALTVVVVAGGCGKRAEERSSGNWSHHSVCEGTGQIMASQATSARMERWHMGRLLALERPTSLFCS